MTNNHAIFTDCERDYIVQQLGREPSGVLEIAARDAAGLPAVISNHPLQWQGDRPVPFPTLYWLIDPKLNLGISDFERRGGVGEIEALISADETLREQVNADHRRYAARRWALLTADEQQLAINHGFADTLRDKGVGGTANFAAIKCLHMHAAYHLAQCALDNTGTAVGRLLESKLGDITL